MNIQELREAVAKKKKAQEEQKEIKRLKEELESDTLRGKGKKFFKDLIKKI